MAAVMMAKAIGKQLTCVFVDHGLLRKDEGDEVEAVFGPEGPYDLNFIRVNAQERFYKKLAGVTEPEAKRKIIGEEFIRVFEEEAKKSVQWISLFRAPSTRMSSSPASENPQSSSPTTTWAVFRTMLILKKS